MARRDSVNPANVDGPWFVDTRCIRCDVARHWAPGLIEMDDSGLSFVARQPESPDDVAAMWRAAEACPTQSIGNRDTRRPPRASFPFELTRGVWALGHNHQSSFGAHSYLIEQPGGNLMVDSPRYLRSLAERVDELGGIAHVLLSHRDDVADADRWAQRYDAEVWIHAADADAAPYATVILEGNDAALISPGTFAVPVPGHTEGSIAFHIDNRWLFTGDTLHWNHRRSELDVTPEQTFYSWAALADSMDRMSALRAEWVFPGHGMWHDVGTDLYAAQMSRLGENMRRTGRLGWAQRSNAAFNWE